MALSYAWYGARDRPSMRTSLRTSGGRAEKKPIAPLYCLVRACYALRNRIAKPSSSRRSVAGYKMNSDISRSLPEGDHTEAEPRGHLAQEGGLQHIRREERLRDKPTKKSEEATTLVVYLCYSTIHTGDQICLVSQFHQNLKQDVGYEALCAG